MKPRWKQTTFPTPQHERVHGFLRRLVSEGSAQFFADACEVAQGTPPLRSTTHIIGHLLREAEGDVLDVLTHLPGVPPHLRGRGKESGRHRAKVDAILLALDHGTHPLAAVWRDFAADDGGWHHHAHRAHLRAPRTPDDTFISRMDEFIDVLDVVLTAVESRYASILQAIEPHLSVSSPSKADLDAVSHHLATGVTALAHVFGRLDATWLVPLRSRKAFADPPDVRVHEDGSFSFPRWPQATYLARIAPDLPAEVAATIQSVPIVDNENVHIAFLEAAARMPPDQAARVARYEASWLGQRARWISPLLPDAVEVLFTCLLAGNELATAVSLLRAALALSAPSDAEPWHGPMARIESWSYGEFVGKTVPALAAKAPTVACELLLSLTDPHGSGGSLPWERRPGFEEPLDVLFAQLCDLYLARASMSAVELRSGISELEGKAGPRYRRLALRLLRVHGKGAPDLVVQRATDAEQLGASDGHDEIALMIRDQFAGLHPGDQSRVIEAMREDSSPMRVRVAVGDQVDGDRLRHWARQRLLVWFHLLGPARPVALADEYAALLAECGEPTPHSRGPLFGPNPPRRAAELLALSDVDLLAYLREWVPTSTDPFEPSREGLGREIRACATKEVERFSRLARDFRGLAAAYVANLLWGIHEITKEGVAVSADATPAPTIQWASVLDLMEFTIAQSPTADGGDVAADWTWARRMAADLAEDAIAAPVDDVTTTRAWRVVRSLMRDADPSAERDANRGDDGDTFAINTVRGQALHAAITIAKTLRERGVVTPAGVLPEVISEIGLRVDPSIEPSLAVRCALAMRFNALYNIDRALAEKVAAEMFPTAGGTSDARWAAWRSFLKWNPSAPAVFGLLREPYALAAEAVESAEANLAENLGDHLAWLAVHEAIDLAEADNVVRTFIERASSSARHHALADVGRMIYRTDEALGDDDIARLCRLWEQWADLAVRRGDAKDLSAFGWWFASRHFDPAWSVPMLRRVLESTQGTIDWDRLVLEKLATLANVWPVEVAACLGLLIDSPDEWHMIRNEKALRAALQALLPTAAGSQARAIASRLVARGWSDFRPLAA